MKVSAALKKLGMTKKELSTALGLHPSTMYSWKSGKVPEQYQGKVNELIAVAPQKTTSKKVTRRNKKTPITFEQIEVGPTSPSKVMIMVMDTKAAQEMLSNFMSSETA